LIASLTMLIGAVVPAASVIAKPAQQTWNMVWSDEFNGSSVNTNNWTFETGGGGWGNNELQYYTNGSNATVSGGILTIEARQQSMGGYAYTSTRIKTQGKRQFTYGRFEARLAVPMGQGLWPAFWMLGANFPTVGWPASGEIDIMEHINTQSTTYGTLHWDNNGYATYGGSTGVNNPAAFHTYAIEWNASSIKWFLDGVQFHEANILNNINGTDEFHRPFFFLLNLAVGGNWPGNPNGTTPFPARYQIDYVRVYQLGTSPTATPAPGGGSISTTAWYSVHNKGNGKCVDARSSGTANGTAIQQYTCNSSFAQQFQFQPTSGGYYRVNNRNNSAQVWDVSGVSTADNALIHLWSYVGGNNQQWLPVSEGGGFWHFVARHTGKCLDVPAASTANSVQLVQYTCNGTGAQSFSLQAH
jgi:beta-glucanase (GH16 family)